MRPSEFASKHFGEYRTHGEEIVPTYCPVCSGGHNRDKHTFALNTETLLYNCKRGSCGANGHYRHLLRDYSEVEERTYEITRPVERKFVAPQTPVQSPQQRVEDYLKLRGISRDIWESWGVGESNGNIVFPYHQNGQLVLMKFRKPEKYKGNGPKAWREDGGKAVFWGMDKCRPDKPLIIVEGEFDALALSECGLTNVVSVPSGSEDLTCIDNCWDWLQQFSRVVIWPDNDTPGQEMCRKLITKLGSWRCSVVKCEHKDPNAALHRAGPEGVLTYFDEAKEVPIAGLLRLSDVQTFDIKNAMRIRSSVGAINKHLQGYMGGQVTVVTGVNGSGKSTFVGQELLAAIDQGHSVCAFSGELPGPVFRHWIDLQAAGIEYLDGQVDAFSGAKIWRVKSDIVDNIRSWYADKFFLYDTFGEETDKNLLEVFSYAAMRYDCKMFLIDNLMATATQSHEKEFYRQQADFVRQLKRFARTHDVHVFLVAHPRKTDGKINKMDVAGAGEITNWADNIYSVSRPGPDDSQEYASYIDLFKSRWTGIQHRSVGMHFDERSKRFTAASEWNEKANYEYGWVKEMEEANALRNDL